MQRDVLRSSPLALHARYAVIVRHRSIAGRARSSAWSISSRSAVSPRRAATAIGKAKSHHRVHHRAPRAWRRRGQEAVLPNWLGVPIARRHRGRPIGAARGFVPAAARRQKARSRQRDLRFRAVRGHDPVEWQRDRHPPPARQPSSYVAVGRRTMLSTPPRSPVDEAVLGGVIRSRCQDVFGFAGPAHQNVAHARFQCLVHIAAQR